MDNLVDFTKAKTKHKKKVKQSVSDSDQALLHALSQLQYATIDQLMRLGDITSVRGTQVRLKWLTENKYIARLHRAHASQHKVSYAYRLDRKGQEAVRMLGTEVDLRGNLTPGFLEHALLISEIMLLCKELERAYAPTITIKRLLHDYELRTLQLPVSPDGYVHFLITRYQYPIIIEVDRGTETQETIASKIERYITYTAGGFQAQFQVKAATIIWLTAGQQGRLLNLQKTIEKVLTEKQATDMSDWFYLSTFSLKEHYNTVFLQPRFLLPFAGSTPYTLIEEVNQPP
ncbi:MAG TPA: replication-relaxation family protein [Chloroflexia bacterium]|nr:replication-relaxation family protein [Chloroflexia bacterium]